MFKNIISVNKPRQHDFAFFPQSYFLNKVKQPIQIQRLSRYQSQLTCMLRTKFRSSDLLEVASEKSNDRAKFSRMVNPTFFCDFFKPVHSRMQKGILIFFYIPKF